LSREQNVVGSHHHITWHVHDACSFEISRPPHVLECSGNCSAPVKAEVAHRHARTFPVGDMLQQIVMKFL
jgi:hypothetical protein